MAIYRLRGEQERPKFLKIFTIKDKPIGVFPYALTDTQY